MFAMNGSAQTSEKMHFSIFVQGKNETQCEKLLREQLEWIQMNSSESGMFAAIVYCFSPPSHLMSCLFSVISC